MDIGDYGYQVGTFLQLERVERQIPYRLSRRAPRASVNFVTAHDGFTLRGLASYNAKHNEANGQDNKDGASNGELELRR